MNPEALQPIVATGESETVEFKKSTGQLIRAGESLCAFLNTNGGRVFISITPEGRIIGQQVPDKPNSRLQNYHLTAKGRALLP